MVASNWQSLMFGIFNKSSAPAEIPFTTDVHSHVLWGLDDGAQDETDTIALLEGFYSRGFRKLITTPHINGEFYRDNQKQILPKLQNISALLPQFPGLTVEAAAEYYLDQYLLELIESKSELLTFGSRHLLFELNFMNEPLNLNEFIFMAGVSGYKLVLAHPERYLFLQEKFQRIEDLLARGILFQVNSVSFTGHYSRGAQVLAQKLAENGFIHLLGSDAHHLNHLSLMDEARKNKYFKKTLGLPLLNYSL